MPLSPADLKVLRNVIKNMRRAGYTFYNTDAVRSLKPVHHKIQERVQLQRALDRATVNGQVTVVTKGMDCDCSAFHYRTTRNRDILMAEFQGITRRYEDAEGPLQVWFEQPGDYPDCHESRDLALEAFEDGHPHVVYYD